MEEKAALQQQLIAMEREQVRHEQTRSRLDDIYTILDGLRNHPLEYDDSLIHQLLDCVIVDSKEQITVIFAGGLRVMQQLDK